MVDFTKQVLHYFDAYIDLDQSIDGVIKDLLEIKENLPEEHQDNAGMTVDYGDFFEVRFYYPRDKTPEELAQEAATRASYTAYRRKQYEELKKEFEGG